MAVLFVPLQGTAARPPFWAAFAMRGLQHTERKVAIIAGPQAIAYPYFVKTFMSYFASFL